MIGVRGLAWLNNKKSRDTRVENTMGVVDIFGQRFSRSLFQPYPFLSGLARWLRRAGH